MPEKKAKIDIGEPQKVSAADNDSESAELKKDDAFAEKATVKKSNQQKVLEAENDRLKQELEEHKAFSMRLQADFENYKKRNKAVATDMYNEGIYDTVLSVLPVIDSFDYALQNASAKDKEGIELIQKQFKEVLLRFAVEEIGAVGETFDPNLHNAMMQVEDKANVGKIVMVFKKGYKLGDKILRYAMVQVGA